MNLGGRFSTDDYLEQQSENLIEMKGQMIELLRDQKPEDDGAGGVVMPEGPEKRIAEQKFYFGEYQDFIRLEENANMGVRRSGTYVLVGYKDANMKAGDRFVIHDETYVINFIHPTVRHEKMGEVSRLGTNRG